MSELAENTPVQEAARKNKRRRNIIILSAVTLLNVGVLTLLLILLLTPASNTQADPLIGHLAPNFSLAVLRPNSGKSTLSLSSFKGKPVVLNFWASWCDPCKEEAPLLENAWKRLQAQDKDIVFLGIDFEEPGNAGISFLQRYHITYPAVSDANGSVANKYIVTALPQTIFINRNGIVVSRVARELTAQALSSNLQLIV